MKTASGADPKPTRRSGLAIGLCALASVLTIVVVYYFAFGVARAAQIKDVPLAKPGGGTR